LLIANNDQDYIEKVSNLIHNTDQLQYLNRSLRTLFEKSQDPKKFINGFEKVLYWACEDYNKKITDSEINPDTGVHVITPDELSEGPEGSEGPDADFEKVLVPIDEE
jgi:hypothetical protein